MQKEVLSSETKSLKTLQISIGFASRTYCSLLCVGAFWNVDDYWYQEDNIDKSRGPKSTPTKVFISQSKLAPNCSCYAQFTHVRHSGSPYGISRYISVFVFPKSVLIVHIEYSNLGNAVSVEEAVYGMKIHMYPFDLNKILYKILWEILYNVNFNFRLQFSWNCSFIEESFSKILKIWKVATGTAIFVVVQLPAPKWRHMPYGNSQAVQQN